MPAIHGRATSAEIELSTTAPVNAPIAPGIPMRLTVRQSTFPNRQWETPATAVVPSSARWTDADAVAGFRPTASRSVDEVAPYAIPRAPSTSCAKKPTITRTISVGIQHSLVDIVYKICKHY